MIQTLCLVNPALLITPSLFRTAMILSQTEGTVIWWLCTNGSFCHVCGSPVEHVCAGWACAGLWLGMVGMGWVKLFLVRYDLTYLLILMARIHHHQDLCGLFRLIFYWGFAALITYVSHANQCGSCLKCLGLENKELNVFFTTRKRNKNLMVSLWNNGHPVDNHLLSLSW